MTAEMSISDPPAERRLPSPPPVVAEPTLSVGQWGMVSFLISEVALFSTLIVTYVFYLGHNQIGRAHV